MTAPNIILCSLQRSGGSVVSQILGDLLARNGYCITPFGPEGTGRLRSEVMQGAINSPFYHWTHDPVETFEGMIGRADYRFIYFHGDPRDAAVSWAHDFECNGSCPGMTFDQILEMVVTHNLPPHVKEAVRWIHSGCKVITFRQMREDFPSLIYSILDYAGYFDVDEISPSLPLSDSEIEWIVKKYSFEACAGRRRGDDEDDMLRSHSMLRKGMSGQWETHFNVDLIDKCNYAFGVSLFL